MKHVTIMLFLSLLLMIACASEQEAEDVDTAQDVTAAPAPIQAPVVSQPVQPKQSSIDIASAFSSGQKVKCTASEIKDGKSVATILYIKKDTFRSISSVDGQTVNSIFDGSVYWMWGTANGQEFGLKIDPLQNAQQMPGTKITKKEDYVKNNGDANCVVDSFPDNLLTPPADVEFQDMGQLIAAMANMGQR